MMDGENGSAASATSLHVDLDGVEADQRRLAPEQLKAALLLAAGKKVGKVATDTGVSRVTVWRWCQLPRFRAEVERICRELHHAAVNRTRNLLYRSIVQAEHLVDEGDPQAVLQVLRIFGPSLASHIEQGISFVPELTSVEDLDFAVDSGEATEGSPS